jgi:membrane protein
MTLQTLTQLLKQTWHDGTEDKVPRMGAAISYYSVFSLVPLVMTAIGIASVVFGKEAAQGAIAQELERTIGPSAAQAMEDLLKNTHQTGQGHLAAIVGLAVLLFGASGVFIELQDALNTIWKTTTRNPWWRFVTDRFLSVAIVLGTGFLLLVSLLLSAGLKWLGEVLTPDSLPGGLPLWQWLNQLVSLALITLLLALIYKLLPDAKIAWRDIWLGALITALLFTAGKYLIGWYLGQSNMTSALGAGGSLVVLLVWIYYSSQIVLFGAEFTHVYSNYRKSEAGHPRSPMEATVA